MVILEKMDGLEIEKWRGNLDGFPSTMAVQLNRLNIGQEYSISGFEDVRQLRRVAGEIDKILTENSSGTYEVRRHEVALDVTYRRLS